MLEPELETETESVPEPEPETEAGPEYKTELEIKQKLPVNITNPVFSFCKEKECTVCPIRHNPLFRFRAYEKVDSQMKYQLLLSNG